MKLTACVLTFNALSTGRMGFLRRCLLSLDAECDTILLDGGSTDGSAALLAEAFAGMHVNEDADKTVGHTMNQAIGLALATQPDLVLFSADDLEYRPGWAARLLAFWQAAPPDIGLCTLQLEADYAWNQPEGIIDAGGERALIRATVPGSCWSFRADNWPHIGPVPRLTGGEDIQVCHRLRGMGFRLAALDLADHVGEQHSAWGNQSWKVAKPLDRERWGI